MARILIVDDETVSRVLLRHLLTARGHDVVEADDGATAAQLFDDGGADLIISDQEMPTMTGLELRRHLDGRLTGPFVLLTGYSTGEQFALTDDADDVDAFLTKPVSSSRIGELLEHFGL